MASTLRWVVAALATAAATVAPAAAARPMPPSPAAPVVIHDEGGVSILELIDPQVEGESAPDVVPAPVPATVTVFPVRSPRGAPGRLEPNPQQARLKGGPGRMIVVIGDDPESIAWLRARASELQAARAGVLVAQVESQARFAALRALAEGLPFVPASADALLKQLGLSVWPLLISAEGEVSQ